MALQMSGVMAITAGKAETVWIVMVALLKRKPGNEKASQCFCIL